MVLRYLGTSNYEVDYQGKVILLDAFYDGKRGPDARLIGLKGSDVTHADSIYIGHPHVDHIADAPAIAKRLNSPVFVAPAGKPVLEREHVPPGLQRYVSGGESIKMDGYTVMTALARHSNLDPKTAALYKQAAGAAEPPSAEEMQYVKDIVAGYNPASVDPGMDIPSHGTIAYVLVFDNGFKLAFRDSPGLPTDGERVLIQKLGGSVDLAILGYNGFGTKPVVDVTLGLAKLYQPKIFLPAHQDALFSGVTDFSTVPLFEAFRDQLPGLRSIDPMYRTPICVNTKTDDVYYNPSAGTDANFKK
jgi:L-ascorbate metabolism protein UlaG (beta-lactamase superfamily)